MQKRRHRITVNLSPEIIDTLDRVKKLTGKTYSNQIYELLNELHPALKLLAHNLEMAKGLEAKSKQQLKVALNEVSPSMSELSKKAEELAAAADDQLDLLSALVGGNKRDGD